MGIISGMVQKWDEDPGPTSKFKIGTPGPPSKFDSGIPGLPSKFKSETHKIVFLKIVFLHKYKYI